MATITPESRFNDIVDEYGRQVFDGPILPTDDLLPGDSSIDTVEVGGPVAYVELDYTSPERPNRLQRARQRLGRLASHFARPNPGKNDFDQAQHDPGLLAEIGELEPVSALDWRDPAEQATGRNLFDKPDKVDFVRQKGRFAERVGALRDRLASSEHRRKFVISAATLGVAAVGTVVVAAGQRAGVDFSQTLETAQSLFGHGAEVPGSVGVAVNLSAAGTEVAESAATIIENAGAAGAVETIPVPIERVPLELNGGGLTQLLADKSDVVVSVSVDVAPKSTLSDVFARAYDISYDDAWQMAADNEVEITAALGDQLYDGLHINEAGSLEIPTSLGEHLNSYYAAKFAAAD